MGRRCKVSGGVKGCWGEGRGVSKEVVVSLWDEESAWRRGEGGGSRGRRLER